MAVARVVSEIDTSYTFSYLEDVAIIHVETIIEILPTPYALDFGIALGDRLLAIFPLDEINHWQFVHSFPLVQSSKIPAVACIFPRSPQCHSQLARVDD